MGLLAVVALLFVVTGPLLVFSSASPISEPNPLVSASAALSIVVGPRATALPAQFDRSRSEYRLATFSRFELLTLPASHPLLAHDFRLHHCRDAQTDSEAHRSCGYRYLIGDDHNHLLRTTYYALRAT